ncbi:MAG: Ig-like domain-containing protein [Verrucomicrobiota bacterium]
MKAISNQSWTLRASKSTTAHRLTVWSCLALTILCLAVTIVPKALAANLTWTTNTTGISEGAGKWNQGSASTTIGNGAWYNGSTYGNTMNDGDTVAFGGGTAGSTAANVTITNGTTLSPGNIISLTPFWGGTSFQYIIGTNGFNSGGTGSHAGNPINMNGGTITNWASTGIAFSCPVNGSFNYGAGNNGFNCKVAFNGDGNQTGTNIINVGAGVIQLGFNAGQRGSLGAAQIVLNNNASLIWRRASLAGGYIVSNVVSGSGSVQYQLNGGLFIVQSNQTYSGATWVLPTATSSTYATLRLGASNVLPATTDLQLNQAFRAAGNTNVVTFDMNGKNQTVASIATDTNCTATPASAIITGGSSCTLTLAGASRTKFFNGQITGGLNLFLAGVNSRLTLTNASTYTGNTTISNGTLALGPSGSINNTARIAIGAGATFDVSLIPSFTLSSSTTFSAGGTTNAATLKGASGSTVSLGSQPIILNYDGTGTNAALTVSQGQLVLNGNLFTINGPALAPGDYLIITNIGSLVSSSGSYGVNGSALYGTLGSIIVSGGAVNLHVVAADVSAANSSVTASPDNLPADNSSVSTVTATIKDSSNNPIVGLGVNWSVNGSDNTISPAASGVTDGSGQVTFTVKSAKAETKLVAVTVGAFTITNSLAITFSVPGSGNSLTWDPGHLGTGSNGSGTWDTNSANWANSGADFAWPNNGNDTANFGLSAVLPSSYIVTLGSPITVGNINFLYNNSQEYDFEGTSALTFAGTPTITTFGGFTRFNCPLAGTGFNANLQLANSSLRIQNDNPNYTGNVTLNGQGTLQFGFNGTSGNLGSGTITLNDSVSLVVRRGGGTLMLSNLITGSTSGGKVGFQLNGGVMVTLAQANTYSAPTYQQPTGAGNNSGTLRLGITDALPTSTDFTMNNNNSPGSVQSFDLAGFNQTLNSLATDAFAAPTNTIITNSAATAGTLTLAGAGVTTTFGGKMIGKVNLTLSGSGSTLSVQQTNSLSDLSIVTITNGAALDLPFTGTNQIAGLVINGVSKAPGVYSAGTDSPSLSGSGYLLVQVPVTINPNPPVLQVFFSAGTMSLVWPTNLGWILQSNSVGLTTTSAWHSYPADGSVGVTNVSITVDPVKTNVFYRMVKP